MTPSRLAWLIGLIAALLKLILGLCGLARTDNLPTGGLALTFVLWLATGPAGPGRRFRSLVVAASAALMVVLPWFIWNLVNNRIFAASQEGRYADYVIENVDFVLQDVKRTSMYLEPKEVERLLLHYGQR